MRRIFALGVAVFCVMAALYWYFGIERDFFMALWWWDMLMHLIGGVFAGLVGVWSAMYFKLRPRLIHFILGALILGVAVEVLEYYLDLLRSPFMSYELDTLKDIVIDVAGSTLPYFIVRRI